jgi:hypothetical protein
MRIRDTSSPERTLLPSTVFLQKVRRDTLAPRLPDYRPTSRVVLPPLAVTSCFMLPEHGPGCNFFSPIAITTGSFGALFDVLVLTLFFGTHAA